jgi:hypothetical protein
VIFPSILNFISFYVFSVSAGYPAFLSNSLPIAAVKAKHSNGHVIEEKIQGSIEVKGRRRQRSNHLLDDFTENKGYWKLKEEALDRTLSRTSCGRGYGPVVGQTTERKEERMNKYLHNLNVKEENFWSARILCFAEYSRMVPLFVVMFF